MFCLVCQSAAPDCLTNYQGENDDDTIKRSTALKNVIENEDHHWKRWIRQIKLWLNGPQKTEVAKPSQKSSPKSGKVVATNATKTTPATKTTLEVPPKGTKV
jgi:hypothetical protein